MGTIFKGLYLFPISDTISMSVPYFESDILSTTSNYANLIRNEINPIVAAMSIQGNILNSKKDNIAYNCTGTFYNTVMGLYFFPSSGTYYVNTSTSASRAVVFSAAVGGYYGGVNFVMLVKTGDDKFCIGRIGYTFFNADAQAGFGLSIPTDKPGYAVYDGTVTSLNVLNTYNQSSILLSIHNYFVNNPPKPSPLQQTDPYASGGNSEPGGGEGTFEDESDGIDFPSKPTISAVDTGFLTIYIPTLQELTSLSRYLWNSDATTIDFWKKLVADPMDLILGLNILPFEIESSGSKSVVVGLIDTEIDMQYTTDQYVEIDCGSIHIDKFWDAYLDSDPYTRFELYLPYCGTHPIMADEVTGKDIAVKYLVDILSGSCVASVKCGDNVLYQFAGNCAAQIPVTANQFSDMVRSAISVASAIGTMVATSGATAPMGLTSIASTATNSSALKPAVEKSGAVSGMSGQLAIQTPYLIITRPRQCIPENQNKFIGYPSYVTMTLSDLTGFNVVSDIHIEGVPATSAELDELESIIKEGAIYG